MIVLVGIALNLGLLVTWLALMINNIVNFASDQLIT